MNDAPMIDIAGFIQMMRRLYQAGHVHLRELVQNSLEAIHQAHRADTAGGTIRIESNAATGRLTAFDDGIGMTADEMLTKLLTLFHSGWPEQAGSTLGIQGDCAILGNMA